MNKTTIALTGAGLGALAMYLMDPSRGRRRQARLGEAASHISRRAQAIAGMAGLALLALSSTKHSVRGAAARITGAELISRAVF
jgi:hypothetical protein